MTFQPIKIKKIYEEIVEQLIEMISQGELKPGNKLPSERDMAESLGVSRASVREALTALEAIGILNIRPGDGTFVRETSMSETFEPLAMVLEMEQNSGAQMMEVRRVLETELAAMASVRASENDLKKIEEILTRMKTGTVSQVVDADVRFHFAIAEATHNTILLRFMNTVADLMHRIIRDKREQLFLSPGKSAEIIKEHEDIYLAIKEGNPEKARSAMLKHIDNIQTGIELQENQ